MGVFEFEAFAKGTFAVANTWLSSPARVASPSLVAAIPWRLSRRLALLTRCRTSPLVVAPHSSCSRARSCQVLLRSTKLKSKHAGARCVKCYVMGVQGAIVRGEPGLVHNKTADDRVGNTLRRLHVTPSLCDMSIT